MPPEHVVLAQPADLFDRARHVVDRDQPDPGAPPLRLVAEVGEPSVVAAAALPPEVGILRVLIGHEPRAEGRDRLEAAAGKDDLGDDPVLLELGEAPLRVEGALDAAASDRVLDLEVGHRLVAVDRFARMLRASGEHAGLVGLPGIEGVPMLRRDVGPDRLRARSGMAVGGDEEDAVVLGHRGLLVPGPGAGTGPVGTGRPPDPREGF
jgi:hypothetical protein